MPSVQNNTAHPIPTARRGLTYEFTPKHHGGEVTASRWLTTLSFDDEFAIFDRSDGIAMDPPTDNRQVADADGNLYGYEILVAGNQHLQELGTWGQQLAKFPVQRDGSSWHGYPLYPIDPDTPQGGQDQDDRPRVQVFNRMVQLGDITVGHRKRLMKGNFI